MATGAVAARLKAERDPAAVQAAHQFVGDVRTRVGKVVVGQDVVVERVMIALLTGGHLLLQRLHLAVAAGQRRAQFRTAGADRRRAAAAASRGATPGATCRRGPWRTPRP